MKKLIKKITIISFTLVLFLGLGGCKKKDEQMVIAINQFMEHKALDDVRLGFIERVKSLDSDIDFKYINAQGDFSNAKAISKKFENDGVDLILTIGTPSAQSALGIQSIPILFSAVTDPVSAGLLTEQARPDKNITGTSDKSDLLGQIEIFREIDPQVQTIGVIYNTSESNSEFQLKELEKNLKKSNLSLRAVGVNNFNDIPQALESIIKDIDGLYLLSDNMVASSMTYIQKRLIEENIISVSAEESQVASGALITKGFSYYDLGLKTGEMAEEILLNNKKIKELPVEHLKVNKIKVNKNTFSQLNIEKNRDIFKDIIFIEN